MPFYDIHPVITYAMQVQQAMLARDAALLNRLMRDYLAAYRSLKADITDYVKAAQAASTMSELRSLPAMQKLLDGISEQIGAVAKQLAGDLETATLAEIKAAGVDAIGMVQAALPGLDVPTLGVEWAKVSPRQVYSMFAFTDPNGPLYANLRNNFGKAVADIVRQSLTQGVILGMHATDIAAIIQKATGQGLSWAMNTARTSTIWSYRTAQHFNFQKNSKYVRGWYWWSARNERTCMACIAMHGTFHNLSEMLNDHHAGRCVEMPATVSYADLGIEGVPEQPLTLQKGEEWFKQQPQAWQIQQMGKARWKAWQDGAFQFEQLSQIYYDPVYGQMRREASLKALLGDKAKLYYDQ